MSGRIRNASVLGVVLCLALVSAGCGDDDGGGGGSTSTTTTSTTTVTDTTTTTVSTSTTSVTSTSTTTTTTGGGTPTCDCVVTFDVTSTDSYGSLQFDAVYAAALGSIDGVGGTTSCQRLIGDFAAFNDDDGTPSSTMTAAFIAASGFAGPNSVATCDFTGTSVPVVGDFAVTVTDAARPDFTNITGTTTVAASDVTCQPCTGGSTTTTVAVVTTTTTTGGSTTTSTVVGGTLHDVTFDMADAGTPVGALQFEVAYATAGGQFVGAADSVDCDSPLSASGAFVTFNDEDGSTTLNFAAVALAGFSGPTTVARCTFDAPAAPSAGDFVVTVVDASDTALAPIVPFPTVTPAVAPQ